MLIQRLKHELDKKPERRQFFEWYVEENKYASRKFQDQRNGHDEELRRDGLAEDAFWFRQIFQYVDRVRLFGLDTPQGKQALCKMVMTALGCVESTIRVHGDLPQPGVPSGEIREWNRAGQSSGA